MELVIKNASLQFCYLIQTCDALRDLVPFAQFKKRENTHGGALRLVKFQAKSLQLY